MPVIMRPPGLLSGAPDQAQLEHGLLHGEHQPPAEVCFLQEANIYHLN